MKLIMASGVAIAAALCIFVVSGFAADVAKIGVVDIQKVLLTSAAGKIAKTEISKKAREMEATLNDKKTEIQKLQESLERESLVMSKEKRDDKEREIRIKINDIKVLKGKFEKDLKVLENKVVQQIQKEFESLAQDIGREQGYLLIVTNQTVIYAPNTIDITGELIQKYDAAFAAKGGTFDLDMSQ